MATLSTTQTSTRQLQAASSFRPADYFRGPGFPLAAPYPVAIGACHSAETPRSEVAAPHKADRTTKRRPGNRPKPGRRYGKKPEPPTSLDLTGFFGYPVVVHTAPPHRNLPEPLDDLSLLQSLPSWRPLHHPALWAPPARNHIKIGVASSGFVHPPLSDVPVRANSSPDPTFSGSTLPLSPLSTSSEQTRVASPFGAPFCPRSASPAVLAASSPKKRQTPWQLAASHAEISDLVQVLQACLAPLFPLTPAVATAYAVYSRRNPQIQLDLAYEGFIYAMPRNRQAGMSLRLECPYEWIIGLREATKEARRERDRSTTGETTIPAGEVDRVKFLKNGLRYILANPAVGITVGESSIPGVIRRK